MKLLTILKSILERLEESMELAKEKPAHKVISLKLAYLQMVDEHEHSLDEFMANRIKLRKYLKEFSLHNKFWLIHI